MYELPLFPLNTVLFPGIPLHLHIFEERYKHMIGLCLQERRPFGVVLIRQGLEAAGPLAEPHFIGCKAHIVDVQHLEDGRMNLAAVGGERFRLQTLDAAGAPYLVGQVEDYPIGMPHSDTDEPTRRLRAQVERYVTTLLTTSGDFDLHQLPRDPLPLAYTAAAILQIDVQQKQLLLELNQTEDLLYELNRLYLREQALLKVIMAHAPRIQQSTSFSVN